MLMASIDPIDLGLRAASVVVILGSIFWKGAQWVERITNAQQSHARQLQDHVSADLVNFADVDKRIDEVDSHVRLVDEHVHRIDVKVDNLAQAKGK